MDLQQHLSYLIQEGRAWVRSQQARYREAGSSLSNQERKALAPFFGASTLDDVRVCRVDLIENPPFYEDLPQTERSNLIDFQGMDGITFVDTVLLARSKVAEPAPISLIFHECVHVVQYQLLGVDDFVEQYVKGWVENRRIYKNIPLERIAYQLEERFKSTFKVPFFVEAEVRLRLEARGHST